MDILPDYIGYNKLMGEYFENVEGGEGLSQDQFIEFFADEICGSIKDANNLTGLSGMISGGHGRRIDDQMNSKSKVNLFNRMDPRYGSVLLRIFETSIAKWADLHSKDLGAIVDFRDPLQIGKAQELSLAFGRAMQQKLKPKT